MSVTNTGGPAFPYVETGDCGVREGMTLRDYFAASTTAGESLNQAMGEIIAGRVMPRMDESPVECFAFWFEVEARLRYMKADAMIAERTRSRE